MRTAEHRAKQGARCHAHLDRKQASSEVQCQLSFAVTSSTAISVYGVAVQLSNLYSYECDMSCPNYVTYL